MKRPAFQFYPADWRKDAALQSCSVAAQGLWINIMCIAHECEPYGHLTVNGKPMIPAQIGRLVGLSSKECLALLDELRDAGVSSTSENGAVYSRRMVRDERLRETRAQIGRENGVKGAAHGVKGAPYGCMGGRPTTPKTGTESLPTNTPKEPGQKPPQNPRPSSSSSSSKKNTGADAPPPDGVSESVWSDFKKLRKAKRAPITDTAVERIRAEATKAGLTLHDAVSMCCARGWQGFEAEWVTVGPGTPGTRSHQQPSSVTVPGTVGRDKELVRIEEDGARAVPPPPAVRERMQAIIRDAVGKAA